jgi:hypothetical protein
MEKTENGYEYQIGNDSTHTLHGGLFVVGFGTFLRNHDIDDKGPQIGDEDTSRCVKPGMVSESVKRISKEKGDYHLPGPVHMKGQPDNEKKIYIRSNHLV